MVDQVSQAAQSSLATNKVLQNTYRLLSMTLLFAAFIGFLAMTFHWPHPMAFMASVTGMPFVGMIAVLAMWYGLLFMIEKNRNSASAIGWVFAFAGFTGYMAGAMVDMYLSFLPNGQQVVSTALLSTAAIFFGASFYVRSTGKDMQGLGKWMFIGILAAFVIGIVAFVFKLSGLSLVVSGAFCVLMTMLIMWQTSEIIHGRETNYISATVTLYVAIYNLFSSLMHLLAAFTGNDE